VAVPVLKAHAISVPRQVARDEAWQLVARLAWGAAIIAPAAYLAVYLSHAWALLWYPFGIDQGEGYDAYSGWLINLGEWIYRDNSAFPYYSSNYPPLYSYLSSIPMAWFGRSLGVARLVSILATLGSGALIGWLVWRRQKGATAAATMATLLFFSSNYVFHTTPLARVNAVALFLALAALALFESARGVRLVLPSALLVAALFTKQMTLDAAIAVGGWLLAYGRWRDAIGVGLIVGAAGTLTLAALEGLTGGHFLTNVVIGNANAFSTEQALAYYGNFAGLHAVLLALSAIQTLREARAGTPSLFGIYFVAAAFVALSAGKWGAGESYFLAAIAAACVQTGRLAAELWGKHAANTLLAFALVWQAALVAHGPVVDLLPGGEDRGIQATDLGWTPGPEELRSGERLLTYVDRAQGLVLAEDPSILIASPKPVIGNATHLRNLWEADAWQSQGLVQDIAARRFDYVILDAQLYPPPVLQAIGRYYYLHDQVKLRHRSYLVFAPGA
jgi:hypothetical protein